MMATHIISTKRANFFRARVSVRVSTDYVRRIPIRGLARVFGVLMVEQGPRKVCRMLDTGDPLARAPGLDVAVTD
jgi:hypothetical protein